MHIWVAPCTEQPIRSLALGLVFRFGGGLHRLPPLRVLHIPLHCGAQTGFEIGVGRLPTELRAQLGGVDRIAAVMARAVLDPIERVFGLAHHPQDVFQYGQIVAFAVRADQIGLPQAALRQDRPHRARMVFGVDPVAHIEAIAIELGADALDNVRDLARNELLHMLVRPVVVRAVRDRHAQAIRAEPGAHEQVGARLSGRIRARRVIGRLLGELRRVVEREVAVDLVGAHVVEAHVVFARRLDQAECAFHVRFEERFRVGDRVVVVRLGRVVHNRVVAGHKHVDQMRIADIAVDELHLVAKQRFDVLEVAGVGERVEHRHMHIGVVVDHVMYKIGADEAAAAGHDDVFGCEHFNHRIHGSNPDSLIPLACMINSDLCALIELNPSLYFTPP